MCGHTFLYSPPVRAVRDLIDAGELGELYFVSRQSRQPRPSPARRERDLGSRPARLLDSPLLARRPAEDDPRDRAGLDRPGHRRRRVHDDGVPIGVDRERRAQLARAQQAAANRDRRLARRWSSTRTARAEAIKIFDRGVDLQGSRDLRRIPALLPKRATSSRRSCRPRSRSRCRSPISCERSAPGERPQCDLGLARDVVRLAEAAHASLASGGERVALRGGHASCHRSRDAVLRTPLCALPSPMRLRSSTRAFRPSPAASARDSALRRLLAAGDAVAVMVALAHCARRLPGRRRPGTGSCGASSWFR